MTYTPHQAEARPNLHTSRRRELVSTRRLKKLWRQIESLEAEQRLLLQTEQLDLAEELQLEIEAVRRIALRTRRSDEAAVIIAIEREGCWREADIISQTGLTRYAVRLVLRDLLNRKFIEKSIEVVDGRGPGGRGYLYRRRA